MIILYYEILENASNVVIPLVFVEKCRNLSYDYTCLIWKSMVKYINNYSNNFFQKIQENSKKIPKIKNKLLDEKK